MEISYNSAKKMDVVNVTDGKHLGKICDILFDFPDSKVRGFFVTGGKGLHFSRQDLFVPLSAVIKVGEDVILTDLRECMPQKSKRNSRTSQSRQPQGNFSGDTQMHPRRSYDEYE